MCKYLGKSRYFYLVNHIDPKIRLIVNYKKPECRPQVQICEIEPKHPDSEAMFHPF